MKYIRTKDGRIAKYFPPIFSTCDNRIGYPSSKGLIFEEEILNQADSIEELCDEFVLYYLPLEEMSNNESWIPYAQYERLGVWQKMRDEIIDKTLKSKSTLYGAIWTEWGLKYVAKMNDKGELELL